MNTFKQVVNPKFETTGGFKLQQNDNPITAAFTGIYGLNASPSTTPLTTKGPPVLTAWSTVEWADGSTRNTVNVIPDTKVQQTTTTSTQTCSVTLNTIDPTCPQDN